MLTTNVLVCRAIAVPMVLIFYVAQATPQALLVMRCCASLPHTGWGEAGSTHDLLRKCPVMWCEPGQVFAVQRILKLYYTRTVVGSPSMKSA